jgi:hypothetical protein
LKDGGLNMLINPLQGISAAWMQLARMAYVVLADLYSNL